MKNNTLVPLALLALLSTLAYWFLTPSPATQKSLTAMPWQIDVREDGNTSVLGIHLEKSTVAETVALLNADHELAIISDQQDHSGLELYYSHFATGPLKSKLIISINAKQETLALMRTRASQSSYTVTGSRKFLLNSDDLITIQTWTVEAIELLPSASLADGPIRSLFGEPDTLIEIDEQTRLYSYPRKGVAITLNSKAKDVIQYITPSKYARLTHGIDSFGQKQP